MTLWVQGMIFVTMLATGTLLGLWLDLYRVLYPKGRRLAAAALDLFFWAGVTALVLGVLFLVTHLELRLYVFASIGLGLLIYLNLFSAPIRRLYRDIYRLMVRLIRFITKLTRPVLLPFQVIAGCLDMVILSGIRIIAWFYVLIGQKKYPQQEKPPSV